MKKCIFYRIVMITIVLPLVLTTFLTFLSGCASGPSFKKVESIPNGKSVAYFYRTARLVGGALSPSIYDNEQKILNGLTNGGYWIYFFDPGKHVFSTTSYLSTGSTVSVDSKSAGEEIFIRMDVLMGALVAESKLYRVYPDQGREEITECKFVE